MIGIACVPSRSATDIGSSHGACDRDYSVNGCLCLCVPGATLVSVRSMICMSGAAKIGSVFKETAARKMRHSAVSSAANKTRQVQGYEDEDEDKHRSCGIPSARIAAQLFGILHKELGGVSSQGWWKQPQKPQRRMGTLQEYAWSNQRKRCVSLSRIE